MTQVHMTEAEVASNFAAALEKVRHGLEVVVENNHDDRGAETGGIAAP